MERVSKTKIAHEVGEIQSDALRFGIHGVKSEIVGDHPLQSALQSHMVTESEMKRTVLANTYGSAFPLKLDLDRQILSKFVQKPIFFAFLVLGKYYSGYAIIDRFQRPQGALPSSMLGFEALTGSLDDFGFEDYHCLSGIILGPSVIGQSLAFRNHVFTYAGENILRMFSLLGLMFFLFVIGVKTDPFLVKRYGIKAVVIGISAFVVPLAFSTAFSLLIKQFAKIGPSLEKSLLLVPASQSVTGFLVISCLLTELKILNTELGRLAMSSALVGDMIGTSMAVVSMSTQGKDSNILIVFCGVFGAIALLFFIFYVVRPTMLFIIRVYPDKKETKDVHTFVVVVGVLFTGLLSVGVGHYIFFGPLLLGVSMPEGPPIGTALVAKIECFTSGIIFPAYVAYSGLNTNIFTITATSSWIVGVIIVFHFFVKVAAATLPSLYFKVPKHEALVMGLMMNEKGIVELIFYNIWRDIKLIDDELFSQLVITVVLMAAIVTPLVKALYDPSKRYLYSKISNIQNNKRDAPLRVLACVHNPENVPTVVNLLEVSCATRESPVTVVALELIELIGREVAVLVAHQARPTGYSASRSTEQIINAFRQYELQNNGLVNVLAYTAMAHMETMHEDVCNLALEKKVNIVIAPFHRQWAVDGKLGSENQAIRTMNITILEKAPCSVGILVDRSALQRSMSLLAGHSMYRIGVIFTGGLDDGEVLAYAARMARHHRVHLTIIRFLAFGCDNARERKVDNDTIDEFRRQNGGYNKEQIRYKEEVVKNGEGLAEQMKGLGYNYDYLIVGKHQKESQLFNGLDEQWSECPELGIIGDMLASPDYEGTCSILVIRQHNKGRGAMVMTKRSCFQTFGDAIVSFLSKRNEGRGAMAMTQRPAGNDTKFMNVHGCLVRDGCRLGNNFGLA
ncbi:hypothetical protein Sjap_003780 [Stephania japonica]|uniref:Cation/H+ exchanger domain-containing protein n=1 Tax=Stephania japonica TaxID=461633 RepID=A0AAP0KS34_9MAGN